MSKFNNSVFLFFFLILINPIYGFFLISSPSLTNSNLTDASLKIKTYNSEFHDLTCISDYSPSYPNNDMSWMARIAIDSRDFLHVVWADDTDNVSTWGTDYEILYSYFDGSSWSIPIAISDFGLPTDGKSWQPSIAVDSQDNIHVVWSDNTPGPWQTASEFEIFYCNYSMNSGNWSSPIVISDDVTNWNTGNSRIPFIAIDHNDNLHVVWYDDTLGPWGGGIDTEIWYINRTNGKWGSAICVSDDASNFNTDTSEFPSIAVDSKNGVHIVWEDDHNDPSWGNDKEILYRNLTSRAGFGSIIGLSGVGVNSWNNDESRFPIIAIDPNTDVLHVVWNDDTNGTWGTDIEIFYSNSTNGAIWTNATALSGIGINAWNNDGSYGPWITIDNRSIIHVVWHDDTDSPGEWGFDREIFYSNSTNGAIWLNATCLSEQIDHSIRPNDGLSQEPCIAYDSTNFVHVVWYDESSLYPWSPDYDILYTANYFSVGTPILLPITPNPSLDGNFLLNWTPAPYTAYYKIFRSTSNITLTGLSGLSPIATTRFTTFTDSMSSSGTYYYVIVAHNIGGDGSASNCESIQVTFPHGGGIPWWIWLLLILIALMLILIALYYKKKKKKSIA